MFTVCPKCTLTLVVTTVDLRAGQGYVRCGRCANVFNALIALREGDPASSASDTAKRRLLETAPKSVEPALGAGVAMEPEPEPVPEPEPEPELPAEEIVLSAETPESGGEEASMEFDASATDVSEIFIPPPEAEHDTASGNYEAVVLEEEAAPELAFEPVEVLHTDTIAADDWSLLDDDPPADDESIIEESPLAAEPAAIAESGTADPPWVEEMFAEAEAETERVRTSERETLATNDDEDDAESIPARQAAAAASDAALVPLLHAPVKRRPPWHYTAGVVVLSLLLVVQALHMNRQSLVLSPSLGPLAVKIYGWFGVTLMPRWDLTAYSVKQLGAEAEGTDGTHLRVRLSLQNESARVQPLPLLRLTLQDRYGNAVATRDLEPKDYLPKRVADQRLLEPDQRIDAEVHVIDPGKAASSFEIDACLRAESGSIGCSNQAGRRPPG